MSLLSLCPAGNILEPPREAEIVPDLLAVDHLRARILADCLPAQRDFLQDEEHRILGYIGGFGSGKSWALASKLIFLGLQNPGQTLMAVEPSFPMIRTVLQPALDAALAQWEIEYDFRASPQPEYRLSLPNGQVTILCQSALNYQRIRGQNIAAAVWDEADTLAPDIAQKAGEMLLARMRTGAVNQLAIASTPEGFRYCYRTFKEESGPDKRQITVNTMDNPHLPPEFVPSLERNYPSQLIAAYLRGEYVNLASQAIFPDFDRSLSYTDAQPTEIETILVGIDINVGHCATAHCLKRGDSFHFFDEAWFRDTQQIADGLKELYPDHFRRGRLILVPDAAAKQRSTAAAQESDLGLLKRAGHQVKEQRSNPLVQDRLNACNALIAQERLFVGNQCEHWRKSLEQWSYDDKGKPEKGGVGTNDLSHMADAATYVLYRMAAIRPYKIGAAKGRMATLW